jgi:hypothetical protein
MPANAALTNPSWGVTQADVNALTQRAIPVLTNIANGMQTDSRYSGTYAGVLAAIDSLTQIAQIVQDYLQVQGT